MWLIWHHVTKTRCAHVCSYIQFYGLLQLGNMILRYVSSENGPPAMLFAAKLTANSREWTSPSASDARLRLNSMARCWAHQNLGRLWKSVSKNKKCHVIHFVPTQWCIANDNVMSNFQVNSVLNCLFVANMYSWNPHIHGFTSLHSFMCWILKLLPDLCMRMLCLSEGPYQGCTCLWLAPFHARHGVWVESFAIHVICTSGSIVFLKLTCHPSQPIDSWLVDWERVLG